MSDIKLWGLDKLVLLCENCTFENLRILLTFIPDLWVIVYDSVRLSFGEGPQSLQNQIVKFNTCIFK